MIYKVNYFLGLLYAVVVVFITKKLIVGKMIYCTAGISLSRIPSLAAYKRA